MCVCVHDCVRVGEREREKTEVGRERLNLQAWHTQKVGSSKSFHSLPLLFFLLASPPYFSLTPQLTGPQVTQSVALGRWGKELLPSFLTSIKAALPLGNRLQELMWLQGQVGSDSGRLDSPSAIPLQVDTEQTTQP